jgi:hypothetical protein
MDKEDLQAKVLINQLSQGSYSPPKVQGAFDLCPQCNTMHPPVRPGEICPVAPVKSKTTGKEINFEKFLADLKIMLISQFEQRKIEDHEEIFRNIKLETMKILESKGKK